MSDRRRAEELVRAAELGLRELLETALAEKRYADVAAVAPLAEAVAAALTGRLDREALPAPPPPSRAYQPARASAALRAERRSAGGRTEPDQYPRFERDETRLVKVGWSKKERREYEHRTPLEAVFAVADRLATAVPPGKAFTMDGLMPFKGADGAEIPSYQAYLILAWLRDSGAVEQRGKDGYAVVTGALAHARVQAAWEATKNRQHVQGG